MYEKAEIKGSEHVNSLKETPNIYNGDYNENAYDIPNFNSNNNNLNEETVTVKCGDKDVCVTASELKELVEYGIYLKNMGVSSNGDIKEIIFCLDYIATLGGESLKDTLYDIARDAEEKYRQELSGQFGADNPIIDEMIEKHRENVFKNYGDKLNIKQGTVRNGDDTEERNRILKLADQFEQVSLKFPEYKTISDIPEIVLNRALYSEDLEKEIFKYKYEENKKISAAKKQEEKNRNGSLGSFRSSGGESGEFSAFKAGLWNK